MTIRPPQSSGLRPKTLSVAISLAMAGGFSGASAQAQDGRQPIEEITVTASRFQNSLVTRLAIPENELAATLDTLDTTTLENLNFLALEEAFLTLPNISTTGGNFAGGNFFLNVRGFFADYLINNRPVAQFRGSGLDRSVVETVEVLKGPTSIVFGPVSPGGIVNQVLKTPKADDFLHFDLLGNTFGTARADIDVNRSNLFGQDWLRGRLTVAFEDGKAAADEVGREALTLRPVIEADLGESTRVQAALYYRDLEGSFQPFFPLNTDLSIPDEIDPDTFIGSQSNRLENDYLFVEAQVVHEFLENLTLTVRGSYLDTDGDQTYGNGFYRYSYYDSYDPAYALNGIPLNDRTGYRYGFVRANEEEQEYLDVQLATAFDAFGQRNDLLFGATYSDRKTFNTAFLSETLAPVDLTDPSTFITGPVTITLPNDVDGNNNEDRLLSAYAEVYLRPTPWLTIPFGVRYDEVRESRAASRLADPDVRTEDDVTVKTGFNIEVNDRLRVFYSFAESFIPQNNLSRTGFLDPEQGVGHELGLKYRSESGLAIDAAVFRITRQDLAEFDPNNAPGEGFFVAEGEQESEGFEVSVRGNVTDALSLNINYGYANAKITEPIFGEIGRRALVPRFNGSAYVTYEPVEGALQGLRASFGVRFADEVSLRSPTVDDPDRNLGFVDGYEAFDLMVGYAVNDQIDLQLNVFNVFDKAYLESFGFGFGAGGGFTYGRALNAQLRVRLRF
ncbi:MAG: TonB-dependent receptor [Pseudomonadota bacterium]